MHIVAITGNYIPFMKPPVRCLNPFLEDLSVDNDVEVVCPVYSRRNLEDCKVDNIQVCFVDSWNNRLLSTIQTNREEKRHKYITKFLYLVFRSYRFLSSCFRKEAYETDLIQPFIQRVEQIHENKKIDLLISVSFPFYNHIAALELKKRHPDIKWFTFTTDPISYSESNPLPNSKVALARKQEQEVYDSCDYCFCTEELYTNLVDDFHVSYEKVMALPFLLTSSVVLEGEKNKAINTRSSALYAGYLYNKIRNPKLMIDVFSKIKGIKLNLYVRGDRYCRKFLSELKADNVHVNDMVSRDKYIQLLFASDFLVNLSNSVRLQAPSKLLELVSTGKPVINFYFHQDTGYHIIEKYPLGININNKQSFDDILTSVTKFIENNKGKTISFAELERIYPEHLFANQRVKFRSIVNNNVKQ